MAPSREPIASADVHDETPVDFPDRPKHGDQFTSNGRVYVFVAEEDGTTFTEGHWDLIGELGPQGPQGPAGHEGKHPVVDPDTGTWVYKYTDDGFDYDKDSEYPAQGVVRVLGVVNNKNLLPDAKKSNKGDAYFISREDVDGGASHLWMIPYHDEGNAYNVWLDMGKLGASGARGPKGVQGLPGENGKDGKAVAEIVDVLPVGSYEEGKIFMERGTNTVFIAITPVV